MVLALTLSAVAGLAVAIYAFLIEPAWVEVTRHVVRARVVSPLTIAHLSDLHIDGFGRRERRVLALLAREQPDAILISGDSVGAKGNQEAVADFLEQLAAPLGVWLVKGNWEHWRPAEDEVNMYKAAGVRFLDNAHALLREDVWLAGFDDSLAGTPKAEFPAAPSGVFRIGLIHSPDYFETVAAHAGLVLAGHTHGGQIRIPFLPPLWLPPGSGPYVAGWYDAEENDSRMYVSRGIGNSLLPARLFCRPELPIITLTPESE